jgi:hypothetical protein
MSKVQKVSGVDMSKVKFDCVNKALVKHGLPIGGTDAQKVLRLAAYYRQATPKSRLADCSTCEGVSDVEEESCPFCGDGAVEEEAVPVVSIVPAKPPQVLVKVERKKQEIVVVEQPATEKDLDAAVAAIHELKARATESLWDLGNDIGKLHKSGLWKIRRSDDGSPKYKSWGQFTESELGITQGYSYKLMDVAGAYSRDQLRQFGPSKLYLSLTVPPEARKVVLQQIEEGASVSELRTLREQIGKAPHDTGRSKKVGALAHKPGAKKGGRKPEKITVAMLLNRVEMVGTKPGTDRPVKIRLPSQIVAEERLFNGVTQRIVVTNEEDGTVLIIVERVRE